MLRKLIFCVLALGLLFGGCDCRRGGGTPVPIGVHGSVDDFVRRQEALDSSLELLNSLEMYPSLPEMSGAARLVQTADRLNKWIAERPANSNWQPDEFLLVLGNSAKRCEDAARDVVRLLRVLQGRPEGEPSEEPVPLSLEEERKQVVLLLTQLDTELRAFAELCEIPNLAVFLRQIMELQTRFSNLDSIANLTPARIRAFARQWETETQQFAVFAEGLERLSYEFRVEGLFIHPSDVDYLKQRIWIRNISTWARGESALPLQRVKALFDWTVRNVEVRDEMLAIDRQREIALPQQYPWQSLLIGKCSVWDRVWIFLELLQEQRIDACILSVPHPENPQTKFYWAVGVLIDDEIYLFLPYHGLPIPGPGGLALAENGELDCKDIATLTQVIQDDSLLRRLDLPDAKFPLNADAIKQSTAHIFVTPFAVSQRMQVLELALSAEHSMVLYVDAQEQRRLFGTIPNISKVELWKYPYRTMFEQLFAANWTNEQLITFQTPNSKRILHRLKQMQDALAAMAGEETEQISPNVDYSEFSENNDFGLWSGRIFYFKGRITGQESAVMSFQDARIPDRDLLALRSDPMFRLDPVQEQLFRLATLNAIYWLGMASYETGSISAAKDYWGSRDISGRNPWTNGIQYMLGRIAEREKDYEKAVIHFERSVGTPSAIGNRLRARWLREIGQ